MTMRAPHTSKGKTREQHERDTRTALLDAVESLFGEFGSEGITNRAIAERAGTTTQPIYTFFKGQEALVQEMYDRAISGFFNIMTSSISGSVDSEAGAQAMWRKAALLYRSYCLYYPARFRLIREKRNIWGHDTGVLHEELLDLLASMSDWKSEPSDLMRERLRVSVSAINGFILAEQQGSIPAAYADELYSELVDRMSASYRVIRAGLASSG